VPRVVVSGEAMVLGMFPDALPFVDYVPNDEDLQLSMWSSWPTWLMRGTLDVERPRVAATVDRLFTHDAVNKLAAYFNFEKPCLAKGATACILAINDVVTARRAEGTKMHSWVTDQRPAMLTVAATFFGDLLGYDPAEEYKKQVGSYGFPLASEMMTLFRDATAPPSGFSYQLFHRAAHDWTLFPFYSSLGFWTPADLDKPDFIVQFAEAVVLELHRDAGGLFVKAMRGRPQEEPPANDAAYNYTMTPLPMKCLHADGTSTLSTASTRGGCAFDDMWRQINSTRPQSADGVCHVTPEILRNAKCDGNDAPDAGSPCYFYRDHCPAAPCGTVPGGMADVAKDFECAAMSPGVPEGIDTGIVVATAIIALVVGALMGFFLTGFSPLRRFCVPTSSEPERREAADASQFAE
jgi:hypothetical protein